MSTETPLLTVSLADITSETLTEPVLTGFLWSVKVSQGWLSVEVIDRLVALLQTGDYMQVLLTYALPVRRDQLIAVWTYGLTGEVLSCTEISERLGLDPRCRATSQQVALIQRANRKRLSVVLGMNQEDLDEFRGDCVSSLELELNTMLMLFEMGIRLISQLTDRTTFDLKEHPGFDGFHVAMVRVALKAHAHELCLRDDESYGV